MTGENRLPVLVLTTLALSMLLTVSACTSGEGVTIDGPGLIYFYEDG